MKTSCLLILSFMGYFYTVYATDGKTLIENTPMLRALADIESGNNPKAKGKYGERSAYQILPSTWKEQDLFEAKARYYYHANAAATVALKICNTIRRTWLENTDKELRPRDLYVIWHRGWKYYKYDHYLNFTLLPQTVQDRAMRYENVYNEYKKKGKVR